MLKSLRRINKFFKVLTKEQAYKRSQTIKTQSIQYSFNIVLHPGKNYNGVAQITFDLQNEPQGNDILIDFQGKKVQEITINGQSIKEGFDLQSGKLALPNKFLNKQSNYVLIKYENQYDQDGSGCVSFTDVDKKQYLYTQFQPYFANRVFPIFDQPDLKAKMKLAICFPEEWMTAISNEPINEEITFKNYERRLFQVHSKFMRPKLPAKYDIFRQKLFDQFYQTMPKNYKLTSFNQTPLLPSYLYCFVVGPYKRFVCQNTYKNIPMSLYCIQSLQPYLIKLRPYIQQMTNKSFAFFQTYFRCNYAFSKYDQVFAHQYKWGAMQNSGIVTLNDLYLFKDPVSTQKMLSFGNTIVHQLAHHWFGNLVTMKWWDDLWLNQSFAEYISHYCLQKIKKQVSTLNYQSAMLSFYIRKAWGYNQDQLITTHPITGEVANTHMAESIFDGITYSKGAATMKQLQYLIGQENFSKALGEYFNKYKFSNTQLDDLLNCIQKYFPQMQNWKKQWLQKAGGNVLSCQWKKTSKQLTIKQGFVRNDHQHLRVHKIKIAYVLSNNTIQYQEAVIQAKQVQTIKIPSHINPQAILLNYDDLSFVKIAIDQISFKWFSDNLLKINDSLFRAMVWRTLYQMVRDSRITSNQYKKFIIKNIALQSSDVIVQEQLGYLLHTFNQYTPGKYRQPLFDQVYNFIKTILITIQPSQKNRIVILKDKLISFTHSQLKKKQLLDWFKGNHQEFNILGEKMALNVSQKWKALVRFYSSKQTISNEEKIRQFQVQKLADSSDTMIKRQYTCQIMLKSGQQLKKAYQELLNQQKIVSTTSYVYKMQGFNSSIHYNQIDEYYCQQYLKNLKQMLEQSPSSTINLKDDYKEEFMAYMDPINDDKIQILAKKIQKLEQIRPKNDKLRILLLKKIDTMKKRKIAYQYYEKSA